MKGLTPIVTIATLALALGASPAFAQAPAQPAPKAAPPAAPPSAAAQPAAQPPPAQPPAPFPQGAKTAYVNLPALFQLSKDGKVAADKIQKAGADKQKEAETRAKTLQTNQQKLETSGSVMTDAARTALQNEIDKEQREGERFQQDAQAELNELQQQVQADFQKKLFPILQDLAKDKGLQMLFSMGDSGLIWADPGLDLTIEAVKRLDASSEAAKAPAK